MKIYREYIIEYFPSRMLGPGPLSRMFSPHSRALYESKIKEIQAELERVLDPDGLIGVLTDNGLPLRAAREFVHANSRRRWEEEDRVGRHCQIIHLDRNLERAVENLENALERSPQE